jgi:hypothetical protein
MTMRTPAKPQDVLDDLSPIITALYKARDFAIRRSQRFFERESADDIREDIDEGTAGRDSILFPNLMRFYFKRFLDTQGHKCVEEDEETDGSEYFRRPRSNNGLLVTFRRLQVKILKAQSGGLPAPGKSEPSLNFYAQQGSLFGGTPEHPEPTGLNVVVTWDVNANYEAGPLRLYLPYGVSDNQINVHWSVEIPPPLASRNVAPVTSDDIEIGRILPVQGNQQA